MRNVQSKAHAKAQTNLVFSNITATHIGPDHKTGYRGPDRGPWEVLADRVSEARKRAVWQGDRKDLPVDQPAGARHVDGPPLLLYVLHAAGNMQ